MASKRPLDTLGLLQRLHACGVEFVIVGGVAAVTHGSALPTEALDVCAPSGRATKIRRDFGRYRGDSHTPLNIF